jgi:hypothetical protein
MGNSVTYAVLTLLGYGAIYERAVSMAHSCIDICALGQCTMNFQVMSNVTSKMMGGSTAVLRD